MDEPAKSVRVGLRIPGGWSHPRELVDRLPEGYRLTPESLFLPDGTEIEFGAMPADDQFAAIFRSSCRKADEDELETGGGVVSKRGRSQYKKFPGMKKQLRLLSKRPRASVLPWLVQIREPRIRELRHDIVVGAEVERAGVGIARDDAVDDGAEQIAVHHAALAASLLMRSLRMGSRRICVTSRSGWRARSTA